MHSMTFIVGTVFLLRVKNFSSCNFLKTSYFRDTSLQPYKSNDTTFEIKLPEVVRNVDVTVEMNYELEVPDNKVPIHKVTKRVTLDR